jgi:hypothetical protein
MSGYLRLLALPVLLFSPLLLTYAGPVNSSLRITAIEQKFDHAKIFCVSQKYLKKEAKLEYIMVIAEI